MSTTNVLANSSGLNIGSSSVRRADRHSLYYSQDTSVVFQLEDTLFRVPLKMLLHGQYFSDMFESKMNTPDQDLEGQCDERPIAPQGISVFEFSSFLSILMANAMDGLPQLNFQQWAAVLHLSTMWIFDRIRSLAITHLTPLITTLPPLDRIDLARKCQVHAWLAPAYTELCTRDALLTWEDAERLGLKRFFALSQIRERRRKAFVGLGVDGGGSYCASCGQFNAVDYAQRRERAFDVDAAVKGFLELDAGV